MTSRTRAALAGAAALILLVGSYYTLHDTQGGSGPGPAAAETFPLAVGAKPLLNNFPVFKVAQGQWLTLQVTSARPGSIHVHVYEKSVDLKPGSEVDLTFQAINAGRFPIHLHDAAGGMEHLATLEVQPK
jgi:hypothetical protein